MTTELASKLDKIPNQDKSLSEIVKSLDGIFRAYDIRGIYPSTINEKIAYLIGQAFVKFLQKARPRIVVGRDNRFSSSVLFRGLVKGLTNQGAEVIDIGLSTTPMLYWACAHYNFSGGVMITASHLGKEFNGFKLVRKKAIPISEKTGLKKIQKLALEPKQVARKSGRILRKNVLKDYLKFNLKNFNLKKFAPLKIVVDTANAVPGILIPELKKLLPIKIYSLFEKLDGNFPNHPPDPLIKENLTSLQKEVKKKKANFGLAFDGDGDRIIFVDEKGELISGDLITAFLANFILKENPESKILYDIRSSQIVPEAIKENGGQPVVWKVGHSLIKEKMRKENIFFAGELSGHYYLKEHYFSEAPLFLLLKILEAISQTKKNLSELIKPFKKYSHSGEINFKVKNKKSILELLEKKYQKGKVLKIDGLRIDFPNWWFLVRPSGTEDLLRLVVEAKSKKLMEKRKEEISFLIREYDNL